MNLNAVAAPLKVVRQQAREAIFLAYLEPSLPEESLLDEAVGDDAWLLDRPRSAFPDVLRCREYVNQGANP